MRYNLHDLLRKVVAYYKRKHKNVKNDFLIIVGNFYYFYKQNTKFTRNWDTFKTSLKNDKQKNMPCIGTTISIYYNKLQIKLFQNSFV